MHLLRIIERLFYAVFLSHYGLVLLANKFLKFANIYLSLFMGAKE